jgi:hypothetical protein
MRVSTISGILLATGQVLSGAPPSQTVGGLLDNVNPKLGLWIASIMAIAVVIDRILDLAKKAHDIWSRPIPPSAIPPGLVITPFRVEPKRAGLILGTFLVFASIVALSVQLLGALTSMDSLATVWRAPTRGPSDLDFRRLYWELAAGVVLFSAGRLTRSWLIEKRYPKLHLSLSITAMLVLTIGATYFGLYTQ